MTAEVRAIRESEYEECLDLWQAVFQYDSRAYFERYFLADPFYQPEYTRCCFVDGRMVSAAHICRRVVACGDLSLTMGGIANVATLEKHRGRGYNTECLRDAIRVMAADAMDFSLLFTGIHDFYGRLGWEHVTLPYLAGEIRKGFAPLSSIEVRTYQPEDDEAIRAIYDEYNRTRPITVRRSPSYWRNWIGWSDGQAPGEARIAVRAGKVTGYALFRSHKEAIEVLEVGATEEEPATLIALLEAFAEETIRRGLRRMRFILPGTTAVREAAERLFACVEPNARMGGMILFLQPVNTLSGLLPELTDRWRRAGAPSGCLGFDTSSGAVCIDVEERLLRVKYVEPTHGLLSQADLFSLLTGTSLQEDRLDHQAAAFANALFRHFDAWYWSLDGF